MPADVTAWPSPQSWFVPLRGGKTLPDHGSSKRIAAMSGWTESWQCRSERVVGHTEHAVEHPAQNTLVHRCPDARTNPDGPSVNERERGLGRAIAHNCQGDGVGEQFVTGICEASTMPRNLTCRSASPPNPGSQILVADMHQSQVDNAVHVRAQQEETPSRHPLAAPGATTRRVDCVPQVTARSGKVIRECGEALTLQRGTRSFNRLSANRVPRDDHRRRRHDHGQNLQHNLERHSAKVATATDNAFPKHPHRALPWPRQRVVHRRTVPRGTTGWRMQRRTCTWRRCGFC